ncbi:hydrogenase maturation nickel metallochaperone HypA [bacterium]|nr:hydrogenase maturation nickel metallochaperone HypA [bacterium]
MHEFSICQNLVEAILDAIKTMQPRPKRLLSAHVVAGRMRQIVPQFLESAYEALIQDTPAAGSKLNIIEAPIKAKCLVCGQVSEITPPSFACQGCQSQSLDTISGMELYLDHLEVEVENETGN